MRLLPSRAIFYCSALVFLTLSCKARRIATTDLLEEKTGSLPENEYPFIFRTPYRGETSEKLSLENSANERIAEWMGCTDSAPQFGGVLDFIRHDGGQYNYNPSIVSILIEHVYGSIEAYSSWAVGDIDRLNSEFELTGIVHQYQKFAKELLLLQLPVEKNITGQEWLLRASRDTAVVFGDASISSLSQHPVLGYLHRREFAKNLSRHASDRELEGKSENSAKILPRNLVEAIKSKAKNFQVNQLNVMKNEFYMKVYDFVKSLNFRFYSESGQRLDLDGHFEVFKSQGQPMPDLFTILSSAVDHTRSGLYKDYSLPPELYEKVFFLGVFSTYLYEIDKTLEEIVKRPAKDISVPLRWLEGEDFSSQHFLSTLHAVAKNGRSISYYRPFRSWTPFTVAAALKKDVFYWDRIDKQTSHLPRASQGINSSKSRKNQLKINKSSQIVAKPMSIPITDSHDARLHNLAEAMKKGHIGFSSLSTSAESLLMPNSNDLDSLATLSISNVLPQESPPDTLPSRTDFLKMTAPVIPGDGGWIPLPTPVHGALSFLELRLVDGRSVSLSDFELAQSKRTGIYFVRARPTSVFRGMPLAYEARFKIVHNLQTPLPEVPASAIGNLLSQIHLDPNTSDFVKNLTNIEAEGQRVTPIDIEQALFHAGIYLAKPDESQKKLVIADGDWAVFNDTLNKNRKQVWQCSGAACGLKLSFNTLFNSDETSFETLTVFDSKSKLFHAIVGEFHQGRLQRTYDASPSMGVLEIFEARINKLFNLASVWLKSKAQDLGLDGSAGLRSFVNLLDRARLSIQKPGNKRLDIVQGLKSVLIKISDDARNDTTLKANSIEEQKKGGGQTSEFSPLTRLLVDIVSEEEKILEIVKRHNSNYPRYAVPEEISTQFELLSWIQVKVADRVKTLVNRASDAYVLRYYTRLAYWIDKRLNNFESVIKLDNMEKPCEQAGYIAASQ